MKTDSHDPLQPHQHEPNPQPPSADETFVFAPPAGPERRLGLADLKQLPVTRVPDCYIVSTGHGTSGPFEFGGVRLLDLIEYYLPANTSWQQVEVISADGFGNRVQAAELRRPTKRPILLAYTIDGRPLTRHEGLVRLIVPSETDDALRQVKWVGRIVVKNENPEAGNE